MSMTKAEAELWVGQRVVYRPVTQPEVWEEGTVVRVGLTYVFVLYDGDNEPKATVPQDLSRL